MADAYSVTQVNNYIKNLFSRDFVLNRITVRGEISNCKYHSSGHIYFTLKDAGGSINCIMFDSQRRYLRFRLTDGQQIDASGQISIYEKSGSYQLYVRSCTLSGEGILYERYMKLKQELEEMGMFDDIYKKPIPGYAKRVGVVTALTGAAIQDIINISKRRNPYVELILYPALVQGDGAAESIVRGIKRLDTMGLDVLIVGRGGGSIEDLWAFNEEIVAKAIFDAETPIISAVGHETDFTIADFAADLRAPTPSAAAELANFEYDAFIQELDAEKLALRRAADYKLNLLKNRLIANSERLKRLSPGSSIERKRHQLDECVLRMKHAAEIKREHSRTRIALLSEKLKKDMDSKQNAAEKELQMFALKLDGLSPLKKMSGGYGYVSDDRGHAVRSISDVTKEQHIRTYLKDGRIESVVLSAETIGYGSQN